MKVETPQILWNAEAEKGKNAPLLSISIIESGFTTPSLSITQSNHENSHVLVTAGNATSINLWKVSFRSHKEDETDANDSTENASIDCGNGGIYHHKQQSKPFNNKIEYMISLNRHDVAVNAVAFSPDGLHLATAGDSGNIVIWSVPIHKRGNNNGRHFWSTLTKENELTIRIVSTHCQGIVDLSWSSDSKRFAVGTIDSCLLIYEDKHFGSNACNPETHQKESEWQLVFRSAEHGAFVQGVSYDPLGVYIASMGSDRTVRVFPRKTPPRFKKKVLRPSNKMPLVTSDGNNTMTPPPDHQRMVAQILMESKLEIGKTKRIKQRLITTMEEGDPESGGSTAQNESDRPQQATQQRQIKQTLFVDESNCESFFRRLSWTSDGAFLVTPAALWHSKHTSDQRQANYNEEDSACSPSFSTYLFARHKFEEPYRVLPGLDKPSVVVRPNPVLFELPPSVVEDFKENQLPMRMDGSHGDRSPSASGLPYRSIFAVLTLDSVLIYDTHHLFPLSVMQGLHYAGLTDCCWSNDGMNLMVSSSDGYISIINFAEGELGKAYTRPKTNNIALSQDESTSDLGVSADESPPPAEIAPLPPCESGPANVVMAPAPKRAKKMRITPTLVSATVTGVTSTDASAAPSQCCQSATASSVARNASLLACSTSKRGISDTETETVGAAVTKLSLDTGEALPNNNSTTSDPASEEKPKKKKKRVQPLLISGAK